MKIKLAGLAAIVVLAAGIVAAVAVAGSPDSGLSLAPKALAASITMDNVEGGDPGSPSMEVTSWSWGVTNTTSGAGGGGAGEGKADVHDLTFTKVIDKASPKLAVLAASGQHISSVTLTVLRPGKSSLSYIQYTLENAVVTSDQHSGSGDSQPLESVSLAFTKITIKYTTVNGDTLQGILNVS
jgi:type VI secretion system secreted protein Hcp